MSVCDGCCMNMDGASSVRLFDRLPVHLVCRVLSYVPAAEALGVCSCVDTTFRSAAAAACAAVNVDFLGSLLQVSVEDVAFGMEGPVDPLQAARVAARPTLSSGFRVMQSGEGIIVHTTTMTHATAFTPHTALNLSYAVALPPAKEALLRVMGGWRHACEMGTAASSCPLFDPFVLHARQCAALEAASMALVEHGERVLSEKHAHGGRMASGEEAPSSATATVVSTPCLRRRAAA
ncbi:hypothetical protein EON66_08475 [archaeon]|nr:MAG: hypothetical protein EON66_08475 [archaeon]